MSHFRTSPDVRTAQAALDAYGTAARKAGDREETDEYLRLNDAVNDAHRAAKKAKKRS